MATVKYNAPEGQGKVTWNGLELEHGKAVETDDAMLLRKAQGNPFFEVSGFEEKEEAEVAGNYTEAYTGEQVTLVRRRGRPSYKGAGAGGATIQGPSAAVQGSVALMATAVQPGANSVKEVYGVDNPLESQEPAPPPEPSKAKRDQDAPQPKSAVEASDTGSSYALGKGGRGGSK